MAFLYIWISFADAVLPSMLWALPPVLPWTNRAPLWGEQGKLVLSTLQVLPCVWQKKQALKGRNCLFGLFRYILLFNINVIKSIININFSCFPQPLLECERCQNCYHASCLGPNYPKQNKKRKAWVRSFKNK